MSYRSFHNSFIFLIAVAVLLSSLHAVQVLGAAVLPGEDVKKGGDASSVKVAMELHHHTDKTGSQLVKDAHDHQVYADNRSLRPSHKKELPRHKLLARLLARLEPYTLVRHHSV